MAGGDSKRVAVRLAPWFRGQGMFLPDPVPQFSYIVEELRNLDIAYLHLIEPRVSGKSSQDAVYDDTYQAIRANDVFVSLCRKQILVILAGGFDDDKARRVVNEMYPDSDVFVAFGRLFLCTPDLPRRIREGIPLNSYDRATFYTPKTTKGYIDYPFYEGVRARGV